MKTKLRKKPASATWKPKYLAYGPGVFIADRGNYMTIAVRDGERMLRTYDIEWDRCDTHAKVLDWMLHLAGKAWMTSDRLCVVAEAMMEHHGLERGQA